MASHKVSTNWKGNMLFESDNPSKNTVFVGIEDKQALSPKALMLSSLAACSGLDVVSLLDKMRASVADFKIDVTAELTEDDPKYYKTVLIDYHFYDDNLNEKKIHKAVNLSIEKYCGVLEMFRQFATVETAIHFHKKE